MFNSVYNLPTRGRMPEGQEGGLTICAIATAQGGAIGIVRVSGPEAISIVNSIFKGRRSLEDAPGYSIHFGDIVPLYSESSVTKDPSPRGGREGAIDSVLVSIFRAPHSYTGEDSVEISCHGSSYILQQVLSLLIGNGCQMAAPGEFTQRAFLNGKMDLSQAEAVADLIASQNAAQHRVAMSQMRGGISRKLSALRDKLLHLTSLLELELDFSDHEDLEFADRTELSSLMSDIQTEIQRLIDSFRSGNAIKNGIPVAIIGAPNVGKSTLLNQLLHDDKAIVSNIAGTTRDTIEDTITIDGLLFRFIDTAGIRETDDTIESLGIERSIKAAEKAHIIIIMRDPDNDYPEFSPRQDQQVIKIFNKQDTLPSPRGGQEGAFSAINGKGLDNLIKQLKDSSPRECCEGAIITSTRHKQSLDLAITDLQRATQAMALGLSADLVSEDLRQCLHHLADITGGEITTDEVLGNIFKHFCIGK